MRKFMGLALALMVLAAGCTGPKAPAAPEGKIRVVASIYPMGDFAAKVGGERVTVTTLVPPGAEPHDWEPTAADIVGLHEAGVFVMNGAGMEQWAATVLDGLENEDLMVVEASAGIALRPGRAHGEDGEDPDGDGQAWDPHVWLNPQYAKKEMENIRDALVRADPAGADTYNANYERWAARLDQLDQAYADGLAGLPGRDIIVTHGAFGYLCDAYGLNQVAAEGPTAESEPDAARMAQIITFARDHDIRVIFYVPSGSDHVARAIADAVGGRVAALSPLDSLPAERTAAGEDYFSVMEQNLAALKEALG